MPLTLDDMQAIVSHIDVPQEYNFRVDMDGTRPFLQVRCPTGTCNVTGDPLPWSGRKWFLSRHMTRSEVVNTAFKAYLTALEHEARESFKYRGVTIYDPHLDVDALVEFRERYALSEREPG